MARRLRNAGGGTAPACLGLLVLLALPGFPTNVSANGVTLDSGATCDVDISCGPKRADFPKGFLFGTATSAFQVEGATCEGGRGPSIWDTFSAIPGKIVDGSNANVASDSYHKIKEDVALMKKMGMQSYRFSISWPRVLPRGAGEVNKEGIAYYNKLIDALLEAGISPAVTLYHWDLPQALQDKYTGWLSRRSTEDFAAYAGICFANFGDRVKMWITLNEPQIIALLGHRVGVFAPGRCSDRTICKEGNGDTEPYIVAKNLLIAHAKAVRLYRSEYQEKQKGRIGITLDCSYLFPLRKDNAEDIQASLDGLDRTFGWFASPVVKGQYPEVIREEVGKNLPPITPAESELLKGSADFIGLNLYTGYFVSKNGTQDKDLNGNPVGEDSASPWLKVVPAALYGMLTWIEVKYPGIPVYITESGVSQYGNLTKSESVCDKQRVKYFQDYLTSVVRAIQDGANVKGYYAWSLLDNFEWASGYTQRFGIHYVDFSDPGRARTRRASALYWRMFMGGEQAN